MAIFKKNKVVLLSLTCIIVALILMLKLRNLLDIGYLSISAFYLVKIINEKE